MHNECPVIDSGILERDFCGGLVHLYEAHCLIHDFIGLRRFALIKQIIRESRFLGKWEKI